MKNKILEENSATLVLKPLSRFFKSIRMYNRPFLFFIDKKDLFFPSTIRESASEGIMVKETGQINKSLFTLGKVISMLSSKEGSAKYIPFRDSKLTMLLQDSLGGTSKALMIACVSPSEVYSDETISTLNYATRTMNIKNKPIL